jgi:uncharacterized protein
MTASIPQKIISILSQTAKNRKVAEVRIGLGYTSVRLDDGNLGLSWTAKSESGGCTHMPKAGTLAGSRAAELLSMLGNITDPLFRSLGLATANALAAGLARPETSAVDVLDLIDIKADDHVAMVGFFGPLIPRIKKTGCRLDIQELKTDKPGILTPQEGRSSLAACSVAIITATAIVTGTIDQLLASLCNPRAAVILGPSTFMRVEVYRETPVTHLAGVRIGDAAAIERIVAEGGGTMLLKKYMDFETLCVTA